MRRGSKTTFAGITALATSLSVADAVAQANTSPVSGTLGLVTTLDVDNNAALAPNSAGTTLDLSETLNFSFTSETRAQSLNLSGSTAVAATRSPGGGTSTSFTEPNVTLQYNRQAATSDLDVNLQYWTGDVVSSFDIDPTDTVFIIVDDGTLTTLNGGATLRTGVGGPLMFTFDATYDDRDYRGTADPGLFDNTTTTLGVAADLRFTPVTLGTVSVRHTDYDSSDVSSTSSRTMDYGFGIMHELRSAVTLDGSVGYREKRTRTGGPATTESGLYGDANVSFGRPDGSIFGGVSFDNSGANDSRALTFGRQMDLRDGSLSASATVSHLDGAGISLLGTADYMRQLPTGSLNVSASRSLTRDASDRDILFTQLGLGYQHQLNLSTDLNLDLDMSRSEDAGTGGAPTTNRATLTASYSRALTPNWNMSVGYRHRLYNQSGTPSANSDGVFLTLSRDIQFGF